MDKTKQVALLLLRVVSGLMFTQAGGMKILDWFGGVPAQFGGHPAFLDRKSTRLNSSHDQISYAVFCLKKKKTQTTSHKPTPPTPCSTTSTHPSRTAWNARPSSPA